MTLSTFWPVLGPLLIKADTATPPAYVYVARLGKYRNTATGQFVSLEAIFNLRDTNETATVDTLARLSLALSDGQLPTDAWFLAMQQQLRRLTVQQGALGAGGFTALTKRDLKRMDRALQEDWPRLQAFGEAIAKGQLSEAQIRARVNMYAGHARTQFYAAQRRPVHKRSEVVLERRLIKPGEVCPLCSYLASLGWQPYGSLPLPGTPVADWTDGQCYTACRCDLERQVFPRREAKTLVQPIKAFGEFHRNFVTKGGPGSGNFGHHGRPGEVGGSAPALDPDLTFPDEMEFDQHPGVQLSGDLTDLYQTFHIHPADLAAVCDLGLPDLSIHFMAIKKHNGAMSVVGAWKTDHNAEVGSFERELAADAQSAHLETLAFSKGYLDQGLGTKVARGWYRLLANAGYQQAELYADSTIGKYAWAKEGAQYQSSWLASDRTRKFADWVKLRNVPGLDGRLPTFANPQDVANYKHPDGYTLTGKDIQNVEVPDTLVMPLGKAFMLDNYGHGNWDATLDLTRWRETGATGKAVNMGDATDLCQIEGTGGSDAVFWAQYLTEAEGDPILGFDPAPTTKGGEGSGNFGHHGRPGEVGGSAPADAFTADHASDLVDRLPEEVDDATKEREREEGYTSPGHPDVKIKGQLYRLKEYGLTREDAANFLDLGVPNVGCRGSVSVMSEMIGEDSRIHENVLWLQGEWLDTKTGQPIGGASIYFFEGAEDVQFDILDLEGKYINTGAGVALAKRWVGLTATRGYSHAIVFADLTIGKYAWAKEGADYLDPKDARKATNRFGLWVEKRKVPGLDGRLPTFQHASEAARYQHPDGYMLKGRDIDNPDVPPDMALPVGKAFMLDDAYASWGHGSWHASLDLTRVRDMLNGTHKAADVPNTWPSRRGLIFVGHDVPGGSDALFWAQYLTEGEGDPVFGVGPIVKGGAGSGNFGHAGRPGEVGGSAPTTATLDRVWTGEQHEGEATVNKLETGAIGEGIVMDVLSQLHDVPFGTVNVNVNNAPFDVSGDSLAVEVKTGLATNGKSAQHWRATIGQPGKAETELLKQMSAEEKRAHNERKMQAILDRKHALLQKMSEEAGREIHPMTMGLILSGDGTRADVFAFDGFHLRLPWNKYATDEHFLGTYDVPSKTMHWHAPEGYPPPAKALPDGLLGALLPQNAESSLNLSEVEQKALAAALDAVDADFQKVFEWWCQQDKGE